MEVYMAAMMENLKSWTSRNSTVSQQRTRTLAQEYKDTQRNRSGEAEYFCFHDEPPRCVFATTIMVSIEGAA